MKTFLDFIFAALPFVAVGIFVALLAVRHAVKKNKKRKEQPEDYGIEGMCIGMSFGSLIGAMCENHIGICMMLGMILGLVIGTCIPKKKGEAE